MGRGRGGADDGASGNAAPTPTSLNRVRMPGALQRPSSTPGTTECSSKRNRKHGSILVANPNASDPPKCAGEWANIPVSARGGYFKVNSKVRLSFQAKETREGGDPTQAELGPSIEVYFKPLVSLRDISKFDQDDAKKRVLALAVGYHYVPSADSPPTNRLRLDLTSRVPMKAKILISDRNRADLDWQNGQFTWRYRNKLTIERRLTIHSYHPRPYVSAEPFYESKFNKWSTTALYAGCLFPIVQPIQIDSYYEHENNTGRRPNQQLNQFGLALNLYF